MKVNDVKQIIKSCIDDIIFSYSGKPCGVTSEVSDFIPTYSMWYGEKVIDSKDLETIINLKFFDNKSLAEIIPNVDITLC